MDMYTAATIFRFLRVSDVLNRLQPQPAGASTIGISANSWDIAPQIHPFLRIRGHAHDAHLAFNRAAATPSNAPFSPASLPSTSDLRSTWPSPRVYPVIRITDL